MADKYLEYDSIIIFLDVLLLQRPAYRHILINAKIKKFQQLLATGKTEERKHQNCWRLLLVLWLCDALTKLMQRKAGDSSPRVQPDHVFYSALEIHLYQDYLLSAAESFIYFCTVVGLLAGKHFLQHRNLKGFELEDLLRAVIISNMGRLLIVPALIWEESYSALGVAVTKLFVAASNVQALRVVSREASLVQMATVVLLGFVTQAVVLELLRTWLPVHSAISSVFSPNVTSYMYGPS